MKSFKKLVKKHFTIHNLSCLAFAFAILAANTRCAYIYHQPEKPEALKQLKKY